MNVKWEPCWYELDQTIVVGDIDFFYLSNDKSRFANGGAGDDIEIKAEILSIDNSLLGAIKGIITIGFAIY